MTPLRLLEIISSELQKYAGSYAVSGGLAASFFRDRPRLTNDVDIALALGTYEKSKEAATEIIKAVGFDAAVGWIPTTENRKISPSPLIIGRDSKDDLETTVDFLLPTFPWVEKAVERAQDHLIDFGFAKLPTITPEDLLIAKALSLEIEPNRFRDLDDIQSILAADNAIDFTYLVNECERLRLSFPSVLAQSLPPALQRISE